MVLRRVCRKPSCLPSHSSQNVASHDDASHVTSTNNSDVINRRQRHDSHSSDDQYSPEVLRRDVITQRVLRSDQRYTDYLIPTRDDALQSPVTKHVVLEHVREHVITKHVVREEKEEPEHVHHAIFADLEAESDDNISEHTDDLTLTALSGSYGFSQTKLRKQPINSTLADNVMARHIGDVTNDPSVSVIRSDSDFSVLQQTYYSQPLPIEQSQPLSAEGIKPQPTDPAQQSMFTDHSLSLASSQWDTSTQSKGLVKLNVKRGKSTQDNSYLHSTALHDITNMRENRLTPDLRQFIPSDVSAITADCDVIVPRYVLTTVDQVSPTSGSSSITVASSVGVVQTNGVGVTTQMGAVADENGVLAPPGEKNVEKTAENKNEKRPTTRCIQTPTAQCKRTPNTESQRKQRHMITPETGSDVISPGTGVRRHTPVPRPGQHAKRARLTPSPNAPSPSTPSPHTPRDADSQGFSVGGTESDYTDTSDDESDIIYAYSQTQDSVILERILENQEIESPLPGQNVVSMTSFPTADLEAILRAGDWTVDQYVTATDLYNSSAQSTGCTVDSTGESGTEQCSSGSGISRRIVQSRDSTRRFVTPTGPVTTPTASTTTTPIQRQATPRQVTPTLAITGQSQPSLLQNSNGRLLLTSSSPLVSSAAAGGRQHLNLSAIFGQANDGQLGDAPSGVYSFLQERSLLHQSRVGVPLAAFTHAVSPLPPDVLVNNATLTATVSPVPVVTSRTVTPLGDVITRDVTCPSRPRRTAAASRICDVAPTSRRRLCSPRGGAVGGGDHVVGGHVVGGHVVCDLLSDKYPTNKHRSALSWIARPGKDFVFAAAREENDWIEAFS